MIWSGASVVMTGGGSGIGRALSLEMSRRGAHVLVTDINADAAAAVAAECGPNAKSAPLDVRDAAAVAVAIEGHARHHGKLDFVFNNAGIGVGGETQDMVVAHWDRVIDINIRGVVHGVAAAYPLMVAQGSGHIINVASLAGLGPAPMLVPYAMSKHAVVGLSTSLRTEAAALGVRVSALCPAAIETPLLDIANPKDLPEIHSQPDLRRLLTRLAGKPFPVDAMAREALLAIEKNKGIIVIPRKARTLWRVGRMAPGLVEKACRDAVAAERKHRGFAKS